MANLTHRHSEGTRWLIKACRLLKEGRWPTCMELSFDGSDFVDENRNECALVLFDAICGWGDARSISLRNMSLKSMVKEKFEAILQTNPSVEKVSLIKVSCDDNILECLERTNNIKELTIDGCQITTRGCSSLDRFLRVGHVNVLNFHNLDLDGVITSISASLLQCTSLKKLDIRRCRTSRETIVELLQTLGLKESLQSLVLQECGIGSFVAEELDDFVSKNSTLRSLDLGGNSICGDSIALLVKSGLKHNKSLATLILSHNPIGDDGACSIAQLLLSNPTIESLSLIDCEIWGRGCQCFASNLGQMMGLKEIFVDGDMEDYADLVLKSLDSNVTLHYFWTEREAHLVHENRTWRDVEFFLRLNRCKRRILVEPKVPVSLWPLVLEGISGDPPLMYHLLRQKPELMAPGRPIFDSAKVTMMH